ncbi:MULTISPECIES: hypothetical protein [Pseudomonas]|uniref:hypothetical protein n=1 Tax=Pseudomonas TaxID=286 RepID=UPI000A760CFA|nr:MULTISPECIES: hypothetical protein [Pseudomonas]
MTKSIFIAAILTLIIAAYSFYFILNPHIPEPSELGPLGDFIGGNINPILTFISTIVLVETFVVQSHAAKLAREESKEAREALRQQTKTAAIQIFETSFFNIVNMCLNDFSSTEIVKNGRSIKGSKAFEEIEKNFQFLKSRGMDPGELFAHLDSDHNDICFNVIKNFSILYDFIKNNAPEGSSEKYISILNRLIPTHLNYIICIAENHMEWPILKPYRECGFFERKSIDKLIKAYA